MKKNISVRNFWSLNIDEAVVIGLLQKNTSEHIEIFMPLNSQMKDIDLVMVNTKANKLLKIQVKASKAYLPSENQIDRFGFGSGTFITINKNAIDNTIADFFVFLLYGIDNQNSKNSEKITVSPYILVISKNEFISKINSYKKKTRNNSYIFHFWINAKEGKVFDWRDLKIKGQYGDYSKFLDNSGLEKMVKKLK